MGNSMHDFDAAWSEDDDEPVVIRLLGQEWPCKRPSEVPAAFLLRLDRLSLAAATEDVPDDLIVDDSLSPESILRMFAGDGNVDAWLEADLSYKRLAAVSRHLNAVYRGQDPDEGEAQAANRQERRAAAKPKAKKQRSPSGKS